MLRFAVFALLAVAVLAAPAPAPAPEIPAEYRDLIPQEAKDFIKDLTDADKQVIKEFSKNYIKYKNEEEAIAALKAKSPKLGEKAEKLHQLVRTKIEALGTEAKAFAREVIAGMRKMQSQFAAGEKPSIEEMKSKLVMVINRHKNLSEEAKQEIATQFPLLTSIGQNEKVKKLANSVLGVTLE